jgi:glycosylphosphatidylinositol phospholipase D
VNVAIIEVCNTIDDNCDGQVDEGFATPLDQVRIVDPAPSVGDDAGTSIAVIGDVDSDGAQDIVIGMPGEDTAINGGGSAIVISGATRSMICRLLDPNAMTSDAMGGSVAGIGNVTGDSTPDIAVGVIHDDWAGASSGAVQIFDGATCAWVRELTDPGAEAADYFGASIASIGDVTGDTVPDIAVGSNFDHENGYSNNGSVSVFNGRPTRAQQRSTRHLGLSARRRGL